MNANFSLPAIPEEFAEVAAICTATEIEIGGRTMFGIADARDLHSGLKVGRDYANWIKGRITKYGFRDGVDYQILLAKTGEQTGSGGHNALIYRLSLDMAKELAMVENNDQGRVVRRYFIWADDQRRSLMTAATPLVLDDAAKTVLGGIVKRVVHGQITEMEKGQEEQGRQIVALTQAVTALTAIVQPGVPGKWRPGKTAGEILTAAGIVNPPKNVAKWLGNRLEAAGCRVEGKSTSGLTYARMFDPDKSEAWLKNGGKFAVEKKIAERNGQGALALTGSRRPTSLPTIPPDMDDDGIGAIIVEGSPVYFDIRVKKLEPGARYVVINIKGDVLVDIPECSMAGRGGTMGSRGVLTSPRLEAIPGRHDPVPTQWEGVILGKVIERQNVVRIPIAAH